MPNVATRVAANRARKRRGLTVAQLEIPARDAARFQALAAAARTRWAVECEQATHGAQLAQAWADALNTTTGEAR